MPDTLTPGTSTGHRTGPVDDHAGGSRAAPSVLRPRLPLGLVVAMACVAQFMVVLDSTIVAVALPGMRAGLGLSTNQQQWVVTAYLVTLGGLLLLAARAGDLFGRKRVFLFGAFLFTAASLAGGLANGATVLLVARAVQGVGAAALAPTGLSLITASHAEEGPRHRALALWSMMGGAASSVGVVLGGVLTAELSWRWVLFVNVPLGAALLVAAGWSLAPDARSRATGPRAGGAEPRPRLDLPGGLSATLGMGALIFGLSQASTDGWGSTAVVAALVASAVLLGAFVLVEATSPRPLIPLGLFRLRSLRLGNLLIGALGVTMTAATFFVSLYLQEVLGYTALRTGLALLPMTAVIVVGVLASRALIPVVGPRRLLVAGALVASGGVAWLAWLPTHSAYPVHILGPTVVAAAGISLMLLSVTIAGTAGVDPRDAGAASGLLNTSRQVGGAVGLAVLSTVAATVTAHTRQHAGPAIAVVHGYHVALLVDAGITLLAGLAALALPAAGRSAPGS